MQGTGIETINQQYKSDDRFIGDGTKATAERIEKEREEIR